MTEEELMLFYILAQMAPGKTGAQRWNMLQDFGFDAFGQPQEFVAEEFVPDPTPYVRNPVADMYGSNEGYRQVFASILNNVDPESAVDQAIKSGLLQAPSAYDSKTPNPYEIARQFAQREIENEMELVDWEQKTGAERAQFLEKQNRLRQEFEQKRPLSFDDLRGVSAYEQMGAPTVDELMEMSAQQRAGWESSRPPARGSLPDMARMYGERVVRQGPAPSAPTREPRLPQQDIFKNKKYADALRARLGERVAQAQQTYVPTERSTAALRNLALMRILGE